MARGWLFSSLILFGASQVVADQVLVLSGGGEPSSNHHSQYRQTKTLTDHLRLKLRNESLTVMFGAGNANADHLLIADVHLLKSTAKGARETMIPGIIDGNIAATKPNLDAFFLRADIGRLSSGETLFVFVSDHGRPGRDENGEIDKSYTNNCIDLWGFEADLNQQSFKLLTPEERCLSTEDLRANLRKRGDGSRAVFAMSQCFSGSFHRLAVDLNQAYPSAAANICGFTAVTEDATASGCTPDVDGPTYQGYERYFTEQLTGIDIVKGHRVRPSRLSLEEAHREATLQDLTVDIPLATSDFFLWKWFERIVSPSFKPRAGNLSAAQVRAIANEKSGRFSRLARDAGFNSKSLFFQRSLSATLAQHPKFRSALAGGLDDLRKLQVDLQKRMGATTRRLGAHNGEMRAKLGYVLSKWNAFVVSGKSSLTPNERAFEADVFYFHDLYSGFGAGDRVALQTMSLLTLVDPTRSKEISDYKANRRDLALRWAISSGDPELAAYSKRIKSLDKLITADDIAVLEISKEHALIRRALIYRQVIGSWNALVAMKDSIALDELNGLLSCESATLPAKVF